MSEIVEIADKRVNNVLHELKTLLKDEENEEYTYKISENFYRFYISLLLYDPNWSIAVNLLQRTKIEEFMKFLVRQVKLEQELSMVVLKLQYHTRKTFNRIQTSEDKIESQRLIRLNSKLYPLKVSILRSNPGDNLKAVFYRCVVYFSLLTGMGDFKYDKEYAVNAQVLKSVMNLDELKELLKLPFQDKTKRFEQIIEVCTGIRIYNKDCGLLSDGLNDIMKDLTMMLHGLLLQTQKDSDILQTKITRVTEFLRKCFTLYEIEGNVLMSTNLHPKLSQDMLPTYMHLLLLYKQSFRDMQVIDGILKEILDKVLVLEQRMFKELERIREIVSPEMLISADLIFPYFEYLSFLWNKLKDKYLLVEYVVDQALTIVTKVEEFNGFYSTLFYNYEDFQSLHSKGSVVSTMYRNSDCTMIVSDPVENDELEFRGYCCVMLTFTKGFLVQGEEQFGIVKYKGRCYIFSSKLAVTAFYSQPEYFTKSVIQLARTHCGLIHYLDIENELDKLKYEIDIVPELPSNVLTSDASCQADGEMMEKYINSQYSSSLWFYKQQAIRMANLSHCESKSVNTSKKANIGVMSTQIYRRKDNCTQTRADQSTNTNKCLSFIYGLRGVKNDRQIQLLSKL
ncbi:unnamed protein product [Phyllotreta striolata]|uniref:Cilia- and flagella-associated protein 206 n=1 Tax=Phyllotreta striolata TaxID=444603 RepID=A0A9N9TIR8_PHYSR|nr:unnamed protein product [Phyllotreta striolata]